MVTTCDIPKTAPTTVKRLAPSDWADYKLLRLDALATDPQAFQASYEEQRTRADDYWQGCLRDAVDGQGSWLLFAEREQRLVGMVGALVGEERHLADLLAVFVAREARGRGVASTLINAILHDLSHARSIQVVRLYVNTSQTAAVRLYSRLGFQIVGKERRVFGDGYAHDGYLMETILAPGRRAH